MAWILLLIACILSISGQYRRMTALCTCVDLAPPNKPSSCPQLTNLCNDTLYYELMSKQCPKTCGYCSKNITPSVCQDEALPNAPSQCPDLFYLCNNPFYRNLMTQQCPKTCSRC